MVWVGQYYPLKLVTGEGRSTWFDHFIEAVAWCLRNWDGTKEIRKPLAHSGGYLGGLTELFHRSGKSVKKYIAILNANYEELFDKWCNYLCLR
jgi:hypothetical protein